MSRDKVLAAHPGTGNIPSAALALAARHAGLCALFCTSCADACVAEEMDMQQRIRSCVDCADICAAVARLAARQAGDNRDVLRAALNLCIVVCDQCAAECQRHNHEHCRLCATMCRECSEDCTAALPLLA